MSEEEEGEFDYESPHRWLDGEFAELNACFARAAKWLNERSIPWKEGDAYRTACEHGWVDERKTK